MRLFIAAELPEEITEALAETQADMRTYLRGRFVGANLFHVTLAFLGNVESWRVNDVAAAVESACATHSAFDACLGELGSFGRPHKAALWQGFQNDEGLRAFSALALDIRKALEREGLSFDKKRFLPHVTLMRNADLSTGTLNAPVIACGNIDTVTLFASDLSGPQPVYSALHRCFLTQDTH